MTWDELGERGRQVLQAVIFEYIVTAEPVGSRQLAKKYALGLSPATIRNTMAALEAGVVALRALGDAAFLDVALRETYANRLHRLPGPAWGHRASR